MIKSSNDNVESNNPTTIIENSVVLDPSLFLSSNHVPTISEKKKIFKVLQRQRKCNMIELLSKNSESSVESIGNENKVLPDLPSSPQMSQIINVSPMSENVEIFEEETRNSNQMNVSEFLDEPLELNSSVSINENPFPINPCPCL